METRQSAKRKRETNEDGQVSRYNTRYSRDKTRKDEASSDKVEKFRLYGKHEVQVSTGGETDLQKNIDGCTKNPGHTDFIPITTFKKSHLPEGYRDKKLFQVIKALADLTVRIEVRLTSPNRPKCYPETTVPYPFYRMRNKKTKRYGSGQVAFVYNFIDGVAFDELGERYESESKTCPCHECKKSGSPRSYWWEIMVCTATHVVFDEAEASQSTCRFFYDKKDSPNLTLDTVRMGYVSIDEDLCELVYVTCELDMGNRLYRMISNWWDHWEDIVDKYRRPRDKLIYIVSHPHGCFKQVSFGQWVENHKVDDHNDDYDLTKLTYTVSTCPGSSGATVHCIGFDGDHVHSGSLQNGLNCSSAGLCRKGPALKI